MRERLNAKYPLFLSDLNKTWTFPDRFSKKSQISNFVKIRPMGTELLHEDRQKDMTTLTVAFRNFANAPKNTIPTANIIT